jgi:peptidoglycan/xylan/chitin deacetylase (PgdA/CDA1 family)
MVSRRLLLGATILSLLVGALGVSIYLGQRIDRCAYVPLLADELLPNANMASIDQAAGMPAGWGRAARGVRLLQPAVDGEGFDVDGDGRGLQLLGIANYAETPAIAVRPGTTYCFSGLALTDSPLRSPTRARLVFSWRDSAGASVAEDASDWRPVALWTPESPPRDWSALAGAAVAPLGAASLAVRVEPASDDRIYLDAMHLRRGGAGLGLAQPLASPVPGLSAQPTLSGSYDDEGGRLAPAPALGIAPWPGGRRAAVAFTFDWETAMGGLVHSFSAGDPLADEDYLDRAARMREGITTTLRLFQPHGVRATYFANGYNFLAGNPERRRFMGDPTFASWATAANGWGSGRWAETPWFADDPYGTVASHPDWYFGDLIAPLSAAGHEIQSHTFSHFFGGYVDAALWQADLDAWNAVAAEAGVAPATAIAFPWSSSSGVSDQSWDAIERAGVTAVTRLSDYEQYNLFPADARGLVAEPRCRWLPGREGRILACPDFYLTEGSAGLAQEQIELAVAAGGMIDLWAHTEEVVSPAQIAAWDGVVSRAAADSRLWVAPFSEVAGWQAALAQVQIQPATRRDQGAAGQAFSVTNMSDRDLVGLTLQLPAGTARAAIGDDEQALAGEQIVIDLAAGQRVEVTTWPS